MSFLVWNNQGDAEISLTAIDFTYGCPHLAKNGYRMDRWDFVVKSNTTNDHGFYKPEERLGMEMDDLMPVLMPGYTEHEEMPEDFKPEDFRLEEDDEVEG